MGGGAWWAAVHRVAKSQTPAISELTFFPFLHISFKKSFILIGKELLLTQWSLRPKPWVFFQRLGAGTSAPLLSEPW